MFSKKIFFSIFAGARRQEIFADNNSWFRFFFSSSSRGSFQWLSQHGFPRGIHSLQLPTSATPTAAAAAWAGQDWSRPPRPVLWRRWWQHGRPVPGGCKRPQRTRQLRHALISATAAATTAATATTATAKIRIEFSVPQRNEPVRLCRELRRGRWVQPGRWLLRLRQHCHGRVGCRIRNVPQLPGHGLVPISAFIFSCLFHEHCRLGLFAFTRWWRRRRKRPADRPGRPAPAARWVRPRRPGSRSLRCQRSASRWGRWESDWAHSRSLCDPGRARRAGVAAVLKWIQDELNREKNKHTLWLGSVFRTDLIWILLSVRREIGGVDLQNRNAKWNAASDVNEEEGETNRLPAKYWMQESFVFCWLCIFNWQWHVITTNWISNSSKPPLLDKKIISCLCRSYRDKSIPNIFNKRKREGNNQNQPKFQF